jgi:hypothetical protein
VAGAVIAENEERRRKSSDGYKVIFTCHPSFGMGKRIFSGALPAAARFLPAGSLREECRPGEGGSVPKSLKPAARPTVTFDLRYVSRRV